MQLSDEDLTTPVLIAGGGLVGLSTAMFLAQHGIPSLAVERLTQGSHLPRAAHFHMRTLEMFRSAGIEEDVRAQSDVEFEPEGSIVLMDSLAGKVVMQIIPSLNAGVDAFSPCRRLFVTQPGLEPILRRRAEAIGARVLNGHEVVGFVQDADGVTTTIKNVESGQERTVRSAYLLGIDGAHSRVRELAGIEFDGRGVFSNSVTIYFKANVAPLLAGTNFSVIYVKNDYLSGFFRLDRDRQSGFLAINTVGDTSKPEAASPANDVREETLVAHLRHAIGVADMPVSITGIARWRATADIARRFRIGRVCLAGDAAHLMPPNGGFGGNTGIHDGHNLAWKLALVLKGIAGPALLDTYEAERRPVAKFTVEQAYTRYVTRTAPYLGKKDYEPLADDFDIEIGYLYGADAVHEHPSVSHGRPGSRAPHVWIERDGRRISTLDLFRGSFVLLTGADGRPWIDAAREAAARFPGLELDGHVIGEREFAEAYGLLPSGATLVRPDGFVAWRSRDSREDLLDDAIASGLAEGERRVRGLTRALDQILLKGVTRA